MKRIRIGPWELRLARSDWWSQCVDMEGDFADYLKRHIEEILKIHGCSHGHDVKSTAPMFYPELICCALHHQREQGRLLGRAEALAADNPKEKA